MGGAAMSYAIVQVEPFQIVQTFPGDYPPEPVSWPDGAVTHGVAAGVSHGGWKLARRVFTPDPPNEFYELSGAVPSFDGEVLTVTQNWLPRALESVKSELAARIDDTAEALRQRYITPGFGQAMTYLQKLSEARAAANDPEASSEKYPLLSASVGLDGDTIIDVATFVLSTSKQWTDVSAKIEMTRLSAKRSIKNAASVDDAVAVLSAMNWPSL
jgi:hypothetical protein